MAEQLDEVAAFAQQVVAVSPPLFGRPVWDGEISVGTSTSPRRSSDFFPYPAGDLARVSRLVALFSVR